MKRGSELAQAVEDAAGPLALAADEVPRYRIGAVARLTGLSAHQLRVWERRYGSSFSPSRSAGGGRLYAQTDVDRFRMIKQLTEMGNSIGQIAHLNREELKALLAQMRRAPEVESPRVGEQVREGFLAAIREMRTSDAERFIAQSSLAFEPRAFVIEVLAPLLHEVGALWESGEFSIAHEHAATEVMRNQLAFLMRTYAQPAGAPVAVAATPSGEMHGMGALSAALIGAANGQRVIYLGPNVPVADLIATAKSSRARTVMLSVVCATDGSKEYLRALRAGLDSDVQILLGGAAASELNQVGVQRLLSLQALDAWFEGSSANSATAL
ncbi:MAG: MerR family transcriptional regulator [Polyangiaceae bacterium]|nr:MerR family transcriptional regulator [Polyangiaceae bacterium]